MPALTPTPPPGFPVPSIQGAALADKLRSAFPLWALGLEEPGLSRHLAALALSSPDADCLSAGAGLALWSWQRAPLDRLRVELLTAFLAPLPSDALRPLRSLLSALATHLAQQPSEDDVTALITSGETARIVRILLPRLRDPIQGIGWLAAAWEGLIRLGSLDLIEAALSACAWPAELAGLVPRLRAEAAFLLEPAETALRYVEALEPQPFGLWAAYLRAELLLRLGEGHAGREGLTGLFGTLPWHTHLGLKLHTLTHALPLAQDTSKAVILVYSWNKAELVRATLESLARTDYGQARILALDNGSTDGTGEALEACRDLFPASCLHVEHLPVNIGAPGARNWLLALPQARQAEWAVFLDDDVVLPERWLSRLLGAAQERPGTGAAGCRIVSASAPSCLQSADYQLFRPAPEESARRTFRDLPEHVNIFDNCAGSMDVGLFSYTRSAVHVSGCCHALSTKVLKQVGGFDIRFSPTQFDDLDRDLRSAVAGHPAVYAGDLAVAHVQHSSLAKAKGPAAIGQVFGNKIKLEGKHRREDMAVLAMHGLEALWDDLRRKWVDLGE